MRQNLLCYRITQAVSFIISKLVFKRKILRNEIKGKKGPFVVIANHQTALDFVNLIGVTKTPMHFVISNSFYNSLPIKSFLDMLGLIPKQQFQTTVKDMKRMKMVIDNNKPLVIYPAGLMCEDGLSTPIPVATYKFLKWLNADVYVARSYGTYFNMPKWSKGIRRGRTQIDIYKLFSKEALINMDIDEIKAKTDEALLFDAYKEQENLLVKYKNNNNINGLENVLYMCTHCKTEYTVKIRENSIIYCDRCGFEQATDEYAFMHKTSSVGEELRYVSTWSKIIYNQLKQDILNGKCKTISAETVFKMIDYKTHKFKEVGLGSITLNDKEFIITGIINNQETRFSVSIVGFASLPFSPGKYLEIQHADEIYRCVLKDGKLVMKFINMIKIFYELNNTCTADCRKEV